MPKLGKTCKAGHLQTKANTYVRKKDGLRICRACDNARSRAKYARSRPDYTPWPEHKWS